MDSYKNKYLKIYFWQFLGLALNFLSFFIVTPLITSMPVVYGIYSVCISLNIFLNYADLGFLMAGEKFAAESYAKGEKEKEKSFIGTSISIYAIMCIIILVGVLICAYNPLLLIKDIHSGEQLEIARKLLLILAFSIPFTIIRKFTSSIYNIRLEVYRIQRVSIIGSIIQILSVPFVFFNNRYDIVGYYFFMQMIFIIVNFYFMHKSKEYGYGIIDIFTHIKFSRKEFSIMKGLAGSGFLGSIAWMLSFEMDTLIISTMLGAEMVALYAIGRSLNDILRSIFGMLYNPYSVRFNYFVGEDDLDGLKNFYYRLIKFFSYVNVIPVVVFLLFSKPFVISWVGTDYLGSVLVVQFMVVCFLPNYVTIPAGGVVIALNKFKSIMITSALMPIVFYGGVFLTINKYGIESVAFFKWMVALVSGCYYVVLLTKVFKTTLFQFIKTINFLRLLIPIFICILLSIIVSPQLCAFNKSPLNLLIVCAVMGIIALIALSVAYLLDSRFREDVVAIVKLNKH